MKGFVITTNSGKYRVWMRTHYVGIARNETQLRALIQRNIDRYKAIGPNWVGYAESLQKKLDENRIMEIASIWGLFSKTRREPK